MRNARFVLHGGLRVATGAAVAVVIFASCRGKRQATAATAGLATASCSGQLWEMAVESLVTEAEEWYFYPDTLPVNLPQAWAWRTQCRQAATPDSQAPAIAVARRVSQRKVTTAGKTVATDSAATTAQAANSSEAGSAGAGMASRAMRLLLLAVAIAAIAVIVIKRRQTVNS